MDEIPLPDQLHGPWDHALILTYGLDIPFFENALWPQFAARCRNRIVLADPHQYLDACATYASPGLVRHLNHRYVASGIAVPRAAHAKLILLVNPEEGRLLVGSGNVGYGGFASGGELFTRYEYSDAAPRQLGAFLVARELIESGVVDDAARRRLGLLLERTAWLYRQATNDERPVRHNLRRSFLDQLRDIVANQTVDDLVVMSPFYDEDAAALEGLLDTLTPRETTVLVQRGRTSVRPASLTRLLERYPARLKVRAFGRPDGDPYVHAKLYLMRLGSRAICLQGSPNLSRVAMLRAVPHGNLELANVLVGARDAFDHLLAGLDIGPVATDPTTLDLVHESEADVLDRQARAWHLTGGEWYEDRLNLWHRGEPPPLSGAVLLIGDERFELVVVSATEGTIELRLTTTMIAALHRPVPVSLGWGDADDGRRSNPIFACSRTALAAMLDTPDDEGSLRRVGDLDLGDDELERLLADLDAALVIDRRSVWQLAGHARPEVAADGDELRLDYGAIDYQMLRTHPKIRQYLDRHLSARGYGHTRLQIVFGSIVSHFAPPSVARVHTGISDPADGTGAIYAESEAEQAASAAEIQRQRRSTQQRTGRVLRSFIRRYLRGLQSSDFVDFAGPELLARNYVIFSHVLWRLLGRELVEPDFIVDSLLELWRFMWGCDEAAGYFSKQETAIQLDILTFMDEHHVETVMLICLYVGARLSRDAASETRRLALRDQLRSLLASAPLTFTARTLTETAERLRALYAYEPVSPRTIVDELTRLARFNVRRRFLDELDRRYGLPAGSCDFSQEQVMRPGRGKDRVASLNIRAPDALADRDTAVAIMGEWMRFEERDYYRVFSPVSKRGLFCDIEANVTCYFGDDRQIVRDDERVRPKLERWEASLQLLQSAIETANVRPAAG